MPGQTSFADEEAQLPLHLETEQAPLSQDVASWRRIRFLWSGIGFATVMLMGVSAIALHPSNAHASLHELAYNIMPMGYGGGGYGGYGGYGQGMMRQGYGGSYGGYYGGPMPYGDGMVRQGDMYPGYNGYAGGQAYGAIDRAMERGDYMYGRGGYGGYRGGYGGGGYGMRGGYGMQGGYYGGMQGGYGGRYMDERYMRMPRMNGYGGGYR